jgi:DNA-binding MarR family transcriptional regulator
MTNKLSFFSIPYITIIVEHNRFFDIALRESAGFSITEYCILQQLNVYEKEVSSVLFQEFLLLKTNSITTAIGRLAQRGLVKKQQNESDYRAFIVGITPAGEEVCKKASEHIQKTLTQWFWADPGDDRIYWTMKEHARLGYKHSLSVLGDSFNDENFIMPGWVIETKYLQQMWTAGVQKFIKLPLSSYRILATLCDDEKISLSELVQTLALTKSALSFFIKKLKDEGLLDATASKEDKRVIHYFPTEKGRALEGQIREELESLTEVHFDPAPKDKLVGLDSWHKTMYQNYIQRNR